MNFPRARGLAALCLFALAASRAGAVTITQTKTFLYDESMSGDGQIFLGGFWFYQGFDPNLGTLRSATVTVKSTVTVSTVDVNVYGLNYPYSYPSPMTVTPGVAIQSEFSLTDGTIGSGQVTASASGPQTIVQPMAVISFRATFSLSQTMYLTSADDLARLSGSGNWFQYNGADIQHHLFYLSLKPYGGPSYFGGTDARGSSTATLAYTYDIPDAGSTAALLLFGGGPMLFAHALARKQRNGSSAH